MNNTQMTVMAAGETTSLERRMAGRLMNLHPGLGVKTQAIANALADSGLSPSAATMLMLVVYSPGDLRGRGQGTRASWMIKAVKNRYSSRIDKIKNDPKAFRVFLSEMEEVVEMRDTMNGEGVTVSFEAAFLLWELGLDADSALSIVTDLAQNTTPGMGVKYLVKAAQQVAAGHFMELETAIEAMKYGYQYDNTDNIDRSDSRKNGRIQ